MHSTNASFYCLRRITSSIMILCSRFELAARQLVACILHFLSYPSRCRRCLSVLSYFLIGQTAASAAAVVHVL